MFFERPIDGTSSFCVLFYLSFDHQNFNCQIFDCQIRDCQISDCPLSPTVSVNPPWVWPLSWYRRLSCYRRSCHMDRLWVWCRGHEGLFLSDHHWYVLKRGKVFRAEAKLNKCIIFMITFPLPPEVGQAINNSIFENDKKSWKGER